MNMKKSIAGVMAGAMAVSAMATTASAQDQILLTYDLREAVTERVNGTVTLTYDFATSTDGYIVNGLAEGSDVTVRLGAKVQNATLTKATIKGTGSVQYDAQGNKASEGSSDTWVITDGYVATSSNGETAVKASKDYNGDLAYAYQIPFTVSPAASGKVNLNGYKLYTSKTGATTWDITYKKVLTAATAAEDATYENDGAYIVITLANGTSSTAAQIQEAIKTNASYSDATFDGKVGSYVYDNLATVSAADNTYAVRVRKVKTAAVAAKAAEYADAETLSATADTAAAALAKLGLTEGTDAGKVVVLKATSTTATNKVENGYGFTKFTVTLDYTVTADWAETWVYKYADYVMQTLDGKDVIGNYVKDTFTSATGNYSYSKTDAQDSTYYKPLETGSSINHEEIITRLTKLGYTYPAAVLNDVIANNEDVQFTFKTAQQYVDTREYISVDGENTVIISGDTSKANEAITVKMKNPNGLDVVKTIAVGDYVVKNNTVYIKNQYPGVQYSSNSNDALSGAAMWHNPSFYQALYQSNTWNGSNGYSELGADQSGKNTYGSYSTAWNTNLLASALVVNSNWTMQLNQTDAFDWGDTTVTFFWDEITADDKVTNVSDFLTSMKLITPTQWFWDELTVAVGPAMTESAGTSAGLEEEAEEVTEAPAEEEVVEEEVTEEETVDEIESDVEEDFAADEEDTADEDVTEEETEAEDVAVDETTDTKEAPAEEEASPATGNAPIALAVIPVALAAAAVIAKKKN